MARAAVKAKQQAKAHAAKPAARPRGKRRHSGGGNPNQDLFFVKMRRHQKWVYALLAVVFMISFVLVGVGSGNGGGLSQLYTGLFGGGGGSSVSKAQDEIKKNPAKGYRDLATAYETNGNTVQAISALQSYLAVRKHDANAWSELGGLELSQGNTFAKQYQSQQATAQNADPSAPFLPGGSLAAAIGPNSAFQGASQQATQATSVLAQQATSSFTAAVADYKTAAKLQPRSATVQEELATAAVNAGNGPVAIKALKTYLKLYPNSPVRKQVKAEIKQIATSLPKISTPPQPGK
ncbi:MAG TPA: tetratricopeptide repeat protein [Gaiellaceae bacterium]|nr:tetratricopeptide repeat protein [Gaiellaceae bacterium]